MRFKVPPLQPCRVHSGDGSIGVVGAALRRAGDPCRIEPYERLPRGSPLRGGFDLPPFTRSAVGATDDRSSMGLPGWVLTSR